MAQRSFKEFNDGVKWALDSTIYEVLGQEVLKAVYDHLRDRYAITGDEIPYRLDAVFDTLEGTFGFKGARTISRAAARRFYFKMGLRFIENPEYRLQDYIELAKKQLRLMPIEISQH